MKARLQNRAAAEAAMQEEILNPSTDVVEVEIGSTGKIFLFLFFQSCRHKEHKTMIPKPNPIPTCHTQCFDFRM